MIIINIEKEALLIILQIWLLILEILMHAPRYLVADIRLKIWKVVMLADCIIMCVLFCVLKERGLLCFIIFVVNSGLSILSLEVMALIDKKRYFTTLKERIKEMDDFESLSTHVIRNALLIRFDTVYYKDEIVKALKKLEKEKEE